MNFANSLGRCMQLGRQGVALTKWFRRAQIRLRIAMRAQDRTFE
jgi:hypothetical protein